MKTYQLLFVSFLFISCTHSTTKTKEANPQIESKTDIPDSLKIDITPSRFYSVEDATLNDFDTAIKKYTQNFAADTLRFCKVNGVMKLPISDKSIKEMVFTDSLVNKEDPNYTDNPYFSEYIYLGQYPSIQYYLVKNFLYEDFACYLINKKTGEKTILSGIPKLSPSSIYFINDIATGGMGDTPFGFQIWEINKQTNKLTLLTELSQTGEWFPIDFIWENGHNILIKIISFKSKDMQKENGYKNSSDIVYKRLILKND